MKRIVISLLAFAALSTSAWAETPAVRQMNSFDALPQNVQTTTAATTTTQPGYTQENGYKTHGKHMKNCHHKKHCKMHKKHGKKHHHKHGHKKPVTKKTTTPTTPATTK